ncbi:MAG: hypothetical protein H7235_06980 [Bdellovibrionaceae bacterium]|nr:hypothetical protein [Pseudobdellovibrionaceae bacterium]
MMSPAGIFEDQYYDYANIRITDQDGQPYGVYCNALNVTERVLTQDKLKKSEERLKLALSSGSIGFWDWNSKTAHTYLSETLMKDWGIDPATYKNALDKCLRLKCKFAKILLEKMLIFTGLVQHINPL